jgi:hypothetical protein
VIELGKGQQRQELGQGRRAGQHPVDGRHAVPHELGRAPRGHRAALEDLDDLEEAQVDDVVQAVGVADERPALEQAQSKERQRVADQQDAGDDISKAPAATHACWPHRRDRIGGTARGRPLAVNRGA